LVQKDTDAEWTKKNDKSYFGYKNHISMSYAQVWCMKKN
jgi:hypothetical protein